MRKQILIGMMLLTLGAGLIGCGKSETNKTENNTTTAAGGGQVADASTEAKKEEAKVDTSDWVYCSIDTKGSVKYPRDYVYERDTAQILYKGKNQEYAIIICPAFKSEEKELNTSTYDDIFEDATSSLGRFCWIAGVFSNNGEYEDVKVVTNTKKECKVNGHDAFNFTAKTTGAEDNKEHYVYGYLSCTPIEPFALYAVALTDSDSESLRKEIQTEVDAIMNTFETK